MENRIYQIKDKLLTKIEEETQDMNRMDAKEVGELINAVHHLAETEYYCSVADAMWAEKHGYSTSGASITPMRHGYSQQYAVGTGGTGSSAGYSPMPLDRRGYGDSGSTDVMEQLRSKLQQGNPDERERLRREVGSMMGLM